MKRQGMAEMRTTDGQPADMSDQADGFINNPQNGSQSGPQSGPEPGRGDESAGLRSL